MAVRMSGPTRWRAAAFVLLRGRPVLLVAADRDVLGAVVAGERAVPDGEHGRGGGKERAEELLRRVVEAAPPQELDGDRGARHRRERGAALERHLRVRERPLDARKHREGLDEPGRAAQKRHRHARADEPLALGRDLHVPVGGADRTGPGSRPVDEHAVSERHPAEPDFLVAFLSHPRQGSRRSPARGAPGSSRLPHRGRAHGRRPRSRASARGRPSS